MNLILTRCPTWIAFATTAFASFTLGFGLTRHFDPNLSNSITQLQNYQSSTEQLQADTRSIHVDLLSGVGNLRQSKSAAGSSNSYRQTGFTSAGS